MSLTRSFAIALASAIFVFAAANPYSEAANLTWDADTSTTGPQAGSGTWDTTNNNWWTGAANTPWVNGATNSNTGFDATFTGTDGTYTLTGGVPILATKIIMNTGGYTVVNNGTNFLTLTYNDSTGSSTTDANSVLLVAAGKTLDIGSGADSTLVKLNGQNLGFTSQVLVGTGSTLNVNAGATVLRDNNPANGGIRFVGNGTVNLFGTVSLLQGNDGIRISERDSDTINFNVKSGGQINVNTTAGNENGMSLWVAGGQAGAGAGTNTLNIESGGSVTVLNTSTGLGLVRGAGPTGILNLSGTLTTPRVISLAGTVNEFNFTGGTLVANASNASFIAPTGTVAGIAGTTNTFVGATLNTVSGGTINNGGFNIGISVPIGGAGGLTFQGSGVTTLSGASTYAGTTNVNAGTLNVTGSLTSNVVVATNATLTGTGSTTASLTMNGGSTLLVNPTGDFAAVGVNFAGPTQLAFSGPLTPSIVYDVVTYTGGALSNLGNLIQTSRGTIADVPGTKVTFTAGAVLTDTWNVTSGTWDIGTSANWTNGSDNLFWNGDTVVFDDTPGADATATISGNVNPAAVNVSGTTNHTFGGTGSIVGSAALTKTGTGALTINNANSYTGGTNFNGGGLNVNNAAALGAGAMTIGTGDSKTLDNTSGGAITLTVNAAQAWNDDFTFTGSNNLDMGSGAVTLGGSGDRTVTVSANTLTVGEVKSAATQGLTKQGAGTLVLTSVGAGGAASVIGGTLNVSAGTLQINRTGASDPASGDLTATGLTGSGTITNGAAVERWLFINNTADSTFNGALQNGGAGGLGLNKQGIGKLTLAGTNTYSGLTTLSTNGGTLEVTGSASNTSAVTFGSASTNSVLKINTAATNPVGTGTISLSTFGNTTTDRVEISGNTSLSNNISLPQRNNASVAIQNISGNNTLSGAITLSAGGNQARIQSDADLLELSGTLSAASGTRTLTLQGAGNGVVSGNITAAAGVITIAKEGAGTWTLTGTGNTYTGTTTVTEGILRINGTNSGGGATSVTGGGKLAGTGSLAGAVTIGGASAGTLAPGNSVGTFALPGSVTINSNGFFEVEYNTSGAGSIDLAAIGGALNISGGTINFVNETGTGVLTASTYTLATFTGGTRVFTANNVPVNYLLVDTGTSLMLVQQVPEAGAFLCFGMVALVCGTWSSIRRRRS